MQKEKSEFLTALRQSRAYVGRNSTNSLIFECGSAHFEYTMDEATRKSAEELMRLGLIGLDDRIIKVEPKFNVLNYLDVRHTYAANREPANLYDNQVGIGNRGDVKANLVGEATRLQNEYNLRILKIYSAVSCLYAGNRAINFCNQF